MGPKNGPGGGSRYPGLIGLFFQRVLEVWFFNGCKPPSLIAARCRSFRFLLVQKRKHIKHNRNHNELRREESCPPLSLGHVPPAWPGVLACLRDAEHWAHPAVRPALPGAPSRFSVASQSCRDRESNCALTTKRSRDGTYWEMPIAL